MRKILTLSTVFLGCLAAMASACPPAPGEMDTLPSVKNGDLVFVDAGCGPLCDAISSVTASRYNLPLSHMGIVQIASNDTFVIEAVSKGVTRTPWQVFRQRYRDIYAGRIRQASPGFIDSTLEFCRRQLGKAYDVYFLMDNDRYYCSELIYDATLYANGGVPFFELASMTYKNLRSDAYNSHWVAYFEKLNAPIPEGQPGCNPGGISLSEKITFFKLK